MAANEVAMVTNVAAVADNVATTAAPANDCLCCKTSGLWSSALPGLGTNLLLLIHNGQFLHFRQLLRSQRRTDPSQSHNT